MDSDPLASEDEKIMERQVHRDLVKDWLKIARNIVSLQTQLIDKNDDNDAEWCFTKLLMQLVLNYNTHNNNLRGTHQHCRSSVNLFKEHIYAYNNSDLKLDHMYWLHVIS